MQKINKLTQEIPRRIRQRRIPREGAGRERTRRDSIVCRNRKPYITTTAAPAGSHKEDGSSKKEDKGSDKKDSAESGGEANSPITLENHRKEEVATSTVATTKAPKKGGILGLLASALPFTGRSDSDKTDPIVIEKSARPEHIPDIASLFPDNPVQPRKDNIFEGLETHEIRSLSRSGASPVLKVEHREEPEFEAAETEQPSNGLEGAHTIGPYDGPQQDYQADQADLASPMKEQDEFSTILPDPEPAYRFNIKVRSNGKVLDPPSK